ncbi:MAG: hypothetical protein LBD77_00850 [Bifidobacteriaceae bacterium]|jgi:hypothetical protein|nr:hypothetical protein [Bifidobacteriaceae bacterium]
MTENQPSFVVIDDDPGQAERIMARLSDIYPGATPVRVTPSGDTQSLDRGNTIPRSDEDAQGYVPGSTNWTRFIESLNTLASGNGVGETFVIIDMVLNKSDQKAFTNELRTGFGVWYPRAVVEIVAALLKDGAQNPPWIVLTSAYLGFHPRNLADRLRALKPPPGGGDDQICWMPLVMFTQASWYSDAEVKMHLQGHLGRVFQPDPVNS